MNYPLPSKLRRAFKVTPADLAANRNGSLSDNQKLKLDCDRVKTPIISTFVSLLTIIIVVFALKIFADVDVHLSSLLIFTAFGLFSGITNGMRRSKNIGKGIEENQVHVARGLYEVRGVTRKARLTVSYSLQYSLHAAIGDTLFMDIGRFIGKFDKGVFYYVYYLPHSKRVLAVEIPLEENLETQASIL